MTQATIHDELVGELKALVDGLKGSTERGSGPREYLNGLLRDVFVLEEALEHAPDGEDAAWLAPFLGAFVSKLELGPRVLPEATDKFAACAERLDALRERDVLLATLRESAPPLLEGAELREQASAFLERAGVIEALSAQRLLRRVQGGPAPELALAGRLLEGLGLHLALQRADGAEGPRDAELRAFCQRLEGWLAERGAEELRPAAGTDARAEGVRAVQGRLRAPGARAGSVAEVATAGFASEGVTLARPVVVASAGAEPKVLAAARELLAAADEAAVRRLRPVLEAVGRTLAEVMEDLEASDAARAGAALDVVGATLPILDSTEAQERLLAALQEDFPGKDVELLLPSPGSPMAEGVGWESRDLFSDEVAPGTIVKLLRPGMKLGGELVRPALVQVSQGPPPPGAIDEVLELLPEDDPRAAHLKERLQRARCLAAGDAGAQLARELSDLALFLRDDALCEPAQKALRLVLEDPPQQLAEAAGWESVREFLDENFEALLDDGENGQLAMHRLVRPYLQGLRTHEFAGARLRSLGESMAAMLTLFDETLGATAREWLFSELERLAAEGLPAGGHARRLMRTAAKAVGRFYRDGEATPALELTQALGRAGVQVFPEEAEQLKRCPRPRDTFHRLEATYDRAKRFTIVGAFEPAATAAVGEGDTVAETGAVTVSLGPEPALIEWLRGEAIASSALGAAAERLVEGVRGLDRERLIAELEGDAGAERAFAVGLAELVLSAVRESGWSRGDDAREAFGGLFELLERDYKLTLLPGYQTYRRLRELQDAHGEERIAVTIDREGPRQIRVEALGALYRDELLHPLAMTWGVGKPPAYVAHLRREVAWFDQVLEGATPSIKLSPGAIEAIRDFESPDAGSQEGVVRSLSVIVTWLVQEEPGEVDGFCKAVKNAPGLEYDFFPLPGRSYPTDRLLAAVEGAKSPDALAVGRDAGRDDGTAADVERIALYKDGRLVSAEPRARFTLQSLPAHRAELEKALAATLKSSNVVGAVKAELTGHLNKLALVPSGPAAQGVELAAFKTLLEARLVDPTYDANPDNALHKGAAYLAGRLQEAGLLKVERFEGAKKVAEALGSYGEAAAEIEPVFCLAGANELVETRRPLVLLEGAVIQKAYMLKGVPTSDEAVLEFDQVLVDSLDRLRSWRDGTGALVEELLEGNAKQLLPRTIKRVEDVRTKMLEAAGKGKEILPPDTARRDLIRFVLDQVHRMEDAYALLEDKSYRGAFGDSCFRDIVFRVAGHYLSKVYGISIDTDVVAGADTQALVGRFKKEEDGVKPKVENAKVFSVVIPCYMQNGVTIRPATVRVGVY